MEKVIDLKKVIKALNQKPIAYYPIYRRLMGSVAGGVLLSQLMFWYSANDEDEFSINDADLRQQTGLSEWELKTEKYKLKQLDFIEIAIRGVPATTYYKIDIEKFIEKISSLEHVLQTGKTSKLAGSTPSKPVRSTSSKLTFIETLKKDKGEEKIIPQRYQQEFEHWKVEQGMPIFETEFEEPPLFNGADAKEFARLRHDGKQLEEITERYKKYVKTKNNWYATNGYSFAVFAKNYASFNGKIMDRQAEAPRGNGGIGESTGDRTLDVYQSAMRGAKLADEMMRGTDA